MATSLTFKLTSTAIKVSPLPPYLSTRFESSSGRSDKRTSQKLHSTLLGVTHGDTVYSATKSRLKRA